MKAVGVLAVQGDFAEHVAVLRALGEDPVLVRLPEDLTDCTHLILPGGESTVQSAFLKKTGLMQLIRERVQAGTLSVLGTCAGAILLAKEVTGKNAPESLGLLDITVDRNAYGTQVQSFSAPLTVAGLDAPVFVAFIRAPIITRVGPSVTVLASHGGHPVIVRAGNVWALTCHPEVAEDNAVHAAFLRS